MSGEPRWQQPGPQQQWPQQPPPGPWQQQGHDPQGPWPPQPPYGWQQPGGPPDFGRPPPRSRGPIIAAAAIVVVLVVLAIGLIAFIGSGLGPLLSKTALQDLTVGQCFNGGRAPAGSGSSMLFGVDVVSCTEPHTSELAATFAYPGSGPSMAFPGLEAVGTYAEEECISHFADYVGLSFSTSELGMTYVYPLEANWSLGDYSFQCVIHPPDGQDEISESIRNARR